VRYGLLLLPIMIMVLRVEMSQPEISSAVDFFSSLMLFLLVTVLVLGSFTVMLFTQNIYPVALAKNAGNNRFGAADVGLVVESSGRFFRLWPSIISIPAECRHAV